MMIDIDIVKEYTDWLKKSTKTMMVKEWLEVTTPFVDSHNDHIQIYARKTNGGYELTDDGDTLRDLETSGISLTGRLREQIVLSILNGMGVKMLDDQLTVKADSGTMPQKLHNLIQAILAIGDLYVLNKPFVASLFREDVENFLNENNIRFVPSIKLTGRSGIDQFFDFAIPASRAFPERVVQAISRPTTQSIKLFILAWLDTVNTRKTNSRAFGFLNDKEARVKEDLQDALRNYEIEPVVWSKRESVLPELVD